MQALSHISNLICGKTGSKPQVLFSHFSLFQCIPKRLIAYEQLNFIFDEMTVNDNQLFSEDGVRRLMTLRNRTDRYLSAVKNLQEMVSQLREAYQSQLSIEQNDLMKIFTVVTVIFLPLSLLAGWYGMNFSYIPELKWKYGYPVVILVSIVTVVALIWKFKKKKWL